MKISSLINSANATCVIAMSALFALSACDKHTPKEAEGPLIIQTSGDTVILTDRTTKESLTLKDCGSQCQIFQTENKLLEISSVPETARSNSVLVESEKKVGSVKCCLTLSGKTKTFVLEGSATEVSSTGYQFCCTFPEENACKTTRPKWYSDRYLKSHPHSCTAG